MGGDITLLILSFPLLLVTSLSSTASSNNSVHKRFISECREKDPDVIFIGDCILETLQDTETWHHYFAPMHSLNFSIRGDCCENVLWRIENGELDNVKPKIVVLHVGTNNVNNKAEEIADGIYEIVQRIRSRLPDTYIVLPVSMIDMSISGLYIQHRVIRG